jgi:CII-binding regulator of phage lambda lysogenization HflD
MIADHEMRPECAKEFGVIQADLRHHDEFRKEVRSSLAGIDHEIKKLTGNGNKGRVEHLSDAVGELGKLLTRSITKSDAVVEAIQVRMENIEKQQKKIGEEQERVASRMWSERLRITGIVGLLWMLSKIYESAAF